MVVIRLTRFGAKKKPYYRIVAVDREKPRESRYIELLGQYNPLTNPALVKIDMEKYNQWIGKGAQPSVTVKSLVKKLNTGK
ncbi:MAG: 30S ribosomal protein S16 [Candidatus Aminicenantes bacterium]|jgi:small subunit ribosomal protein S16|nr:30S ribosomal protein S16 [Candidatus Aminicenantes bacterium]MBU4405420.1 30S ribosomal protein S16 [Acidobacteriota bacterium]MCG2810823.1 30S ribosomal protein S16 [Candidatus Aminicenantes bacterium]MCJ7526164.1 30S ribosomal protein S16 [Candidatus Aminicenantes bacterium]TFG80968.1 MAG: 30S ribosomal protein S16 [Chrysiogenales bacterium]